MSCQVWLERMVNGAVDAFVVALNVCTTAGIGYELEAFGLRYRSPMLLKSVHSSGVVVPLEEVLFVEEAADVLP